MEFIGKLLPVHGYRVIRTPNLVKDYQLSLSHLYQPLIGMQATMLYQTFLNESMLGKSDITQTHHTLMNYLNSSLDVIYKERLKLEAIGLLKTFEAIEEQQKIFTYVLRSPFSPEHFFQDPMLSQLLYHHVGTKMFEKIKELLTKQNGKVASGKDITARFSDVFETFNKEKLDSRTMNSNFQTVADEVDSAKEVNFSWLETVLKQRMIPSQRILTPANKKLITDMMQLYNLATYDIEKCFLWALSEDHTLDVEEFKTACHDLFKAEQKAFIQLQVKQTAAAKQTVKAAKTESNATKRERLLERLETISLRQLLEGIGNGVVRPEELKMLRDIMTTYGLKPPVMNVLVHYALIQSNMKLSKVYVETIANHWARAKLNTAAEAMEFVQKEITKAQQRKNHQSKGYKQSKEIIPEWFKQQKEQRKQATSTKKTEEKATNQFDEDEILALFHKHSSENKNIQG